MSLRRTPFQQSTGYVRSPERPFPFAWKAALFLTAAVFPWGSPFGMEISSALLPVIFSRHSAFEVLPFYSVRSSAACLHTAPPPPPRDCAGRVGGRLAVAWVAGNSRRLGGFGGHHGRHPLTEGLPARAAGHQEAKSILSALGSAAVWCVLVSPHRQERREQHWE